LEAVGKFGLYLATAGTGHKGWKRLSRGHGFPVWEPALSDSI